MYISTSSKIEWRRGESNPRPTACEAVALPLSYVPLVCLCYIFRRVQTTKEGVFKFKNFLFKKKIAVVDVLPHTQLQN